MTSSHIYEANHHPSFYEGLSHISVNDNGQPFTPYVYKISWTEHNIHYIGASYRAGCHPSRIFNRSAGARGYFTSSKHVYQYVEKFGDPDFVTILSIHCTVGDTVEAEHTQLREADATASSNYLNRTNGSNHYYSVKGGFVMVRYKDDPDKKYFCVSMKCYDPTIHCTAASGKVPAIDTVTGKTVSVDTETFHASDRYVSIAKNHVPVIDTTTGKSMHILTSIYHTSDRYVSVSKDQLPAIEKATGDRVLITPKEYHDNPDKYTHANAGRTPTYDKIENRYVAITTDEYHSNQDRYQHAATGFVSVTDKITRDKLYITSEEYAESKSKYDHHVTNMVTVTNKITNRTESISVDEYYNNADLYNTVAKNKVAVFEKATGNTVLINKDVYQKNKHLYQSFRAGKITVTVKATGESKSVDSDEFYTNRDLYTTPKEGKAPSTKGKSPHVNDEGTLDYFIKGNAPDGYVPARRIYSMKDGTVKWDKQSLIKDFPGQYYVTAQWYDSITNSFVNIPSIIGRADPRYHQCRSETYQKFKQSLTK